MYNTKIINITINSAKDFDGYVNLSITNSSLTIPISIKVTSDPSKVNLSIPPDNSPKTCTKTETSPYIITFKKTGISPNF